MKTLLSILLCAACLGTMSLSARADISPELHKMPLPKPLAQANEKGGKEVNVHLAGIFADKGNPVAVWALEERSSSSVYLCPGKTDGKWGKAQLALKGLPSYIMDGVRGPGVAHDPANSGTLLFYFTQPLTEDGEPGDYEYFVARGKGAKVSPKAHKVKFAKGKEVEDGLRPYPPTTPGIVLKHGKHKGRIVFIMGVEDDGDKARPLYSDDHGRTWKVGKNIDMSYEYNEAQGEPLQKGRIWNRWFEGSAPHTCTVGYPLFEDDKGHIRAYVRIDTSTWLQSEDGGETWKAHSLSLEEMGERRRRNPGKARMPEKGWEIGDNLILNAGDARGNNSRLLNFGCTKEGGLCVSLSYDWGVTWPYSKQFAPAPYEPIGYGTFGGCTVLRPGVIGVALCKGKAAESIESYYAYCTLTLSWLTDGADDGTTMPGAEKEDKGDSSEQP